MLYGKNEDNLFSKTIAAYDLKVGGCIEQNDLMNLHENQRSFFDLRQRSLGFQTKIFFFSEKKTVKLFETKYYVKDFGNTEMKIYTNGICHVTKMAATSIYGRNLSKM